MANREKIVCKSNKEINDYAKDICKECGGRIIIESNRAIKVCKSCGIVLEERLIDNKCEGRRYYNSFEKNERSFYGPALSELSPHIFLLSSRSKIKTNSFHDIDLRRAYLWNYRIPQQCKNILVASTEIRRIGTNLPIPLYALVEAFKLFKKAAYKSLLKGRSANNMIAACLIITCKLHKINTFSYKEFLSQLDTRRRPVLKCIEILAKTFNIKFPIKSPIELIPSFIAKLSISSEIINIIEKNSRDILQSCLNSKLSVRGCNPNGFCGAAIYISCKNKGYRVTQKDVSKTIGVTEITLRSRIKEIASILSN